MIKAIDCRKCFYLPAKKNVTQEKVTYPNLAGLASGGGVHLTLKIQICKSIVKPPETIAKYWFGENCSGSKD